MHLTLTWPRAGAPDLREDFFLGAWHPCDALHLSWATPSEAVEPAIVSGKNWFLVSNRSSLHAGRPGLVHEGQRAQDGERTLGVAFRGYVLDPPIHSYSAAEEVLAYWQRASDDREHNGVFSAACVREAGKRLELVSGVFGMGPMYYRVLGRLVLFATNPRYLAFAGDEPDYMAWRCLIQAGFIAADRTLSAAVHRLPVGSTLTADGSGVRVKRWFDFASLGDGAAMVDDQAIADVHEAFQAALDRVLQLQHATWFLPLSSGHDSRRILAGLMSRNVAFQSATVRLLQCEYRDLDARYASAMAEISVSDMK